MPDPLVSSNTHNALSVQTPLLPQAQRHFDSMQAEQQASPGCVEENIPMSVETTETTDDSLGTEVVSTIRGATYKLLRFHVHDWLALLALAILLAVLNIISPFHRFVGITMMGDLMYPLLSNTVPTAVVPVIAMVIPLLVFVAYFFSTKDITDLHHATLGLLFTVLITGVLTAAIKDAVGRPRPDFFWRCFPDGIAVYSNSSGDVVCHGEYEVIKEGYKSFPSGHTSWCFSGLGFLSLYLAGKLQLFNGRGHVAKVAVVFTPLLAATLVGLSRVDDYWHHWQDVFAGALLGFVMAGLCYHEFFPSVFGDNSTGPYSYLQLGNNFKLGFHSLFRRQRPHRDSHVAEEAQEHDLERSTS